MLTLIENYNGLLILTVFVLLYVVILNALISSLIFPKPACFVIALCVAVLCVLSAIKYFPQEHANSQEVTVISQEDASSQEPQKRNFFFLLLPYLALMISFLLLLIVIEIARLADGKRRLFRPSHNNKNKPTITNLQKKEKQKQKRNTKLF